MKTTRKVIEIDESLCDGCGKCVPACEEGAIRIVNGKARLVADRYCDGLGACLGECPNGALRVVEREAEQFDEEAVQERMRLRPSEGPAFHGPPGGCPSMRLREFAPANAQGGSPCEAVRSALSHWPVQIRLVPSAAPFLEGADLLVAADCVPVAYPGFHEHLLEGRVVLMGCPKFDDVDEYVRKFADLFATADIRSVTVAVMEVPCCQSLPLVVGKGMALAGKQVHLDKIVVGLQGEILERQSLVA